MMKLLFLIIVVILYSCHLKAQPTLEEIRRLHIKSYTEIVKVDTLVEKKKIVYNRFGFDSLIYHEGELSFYTKAKTDNNDRIIGLEVYNARNNDFEELHQINYEKNGDFKVEVIAQGAGLLNTDYYNSGSRIIRSISNDSYIESFFEYNNDGKLEKVFERYKTQKKKLVALTTFDKDGLESETKIYGESPAVVSYEHDSNKMIKKIIFKPANKDENERII